MKCLKFYRARRISMNTCISGKKLYQTYNLAVDALIEARIRFDFKPGSGPIAVYLCEDCGQYHLTSKGKMNETLEKEISKGKIKLQKEASRWMDKFKNR